jgi:hypothetical protein
MLAGVFVEVDMVLASLLAILLIALMSGVLRGIARLSLLSGVLDVVAALLDLMGIAGFGITGALLALIVGRHGRGFGHLLAPLCLPPDNARRTLGFLPDFPEPRSLGSSRRRA